MDVRLFLAELKRRRVYRVAAIYSAGAWALLQIADVLFPLLSLPDGAISLVLIAAGIGFIPTMILAWLFDVTPEGIVEAPAIKPGAERLVLTPTRIIELALIVALIASVGFLYLERLSREKEPAAITDPYGHLGVKHRKSIAVMPFVNISDLPKLEYFGDGLAEEILNLLAKLNVLNVAARTSSFYFKDKIADIQEIGEHLGVEHILEGSVRYDGNRIRVTAQLIETANGFHLWSETYDRDLKDILSLHDEFALRVVNTLEILLTRASRDLISHSAEVDPSAYESYLQGRAYIRRALDQDDIEGAIDRFTQATEADPKFAEGFAGLCDALLMEYELNRASESFQGAERACHRALTLDGQAMAVYVALGNLYRYSGQNGRAKLEFERALAINPGSIDAILGLGEAYFADNKLAQAKDYFQRALDLQPQAAPSQMSMGGYFYDVGQIEDSIPYFKKSAALIPDSELAFNNLGAAYFMLGEFELASNAWNQSLALRPSALSYANTATSLFFLGRFDEAVALYHKSVELAPEDAESWGNLGDAYRFSTFGEELSLPMYKRAIELSRDHLKINPNDAGALAVLGHYYAVSGDSAQALATMNKAIELAPEQPTIFYAAATTLCALDRHEEAMDKLEMAVAMGYPLHLARVDAGLHELRKMSRFEALSAPES